GAPVASLHSPQEPPSRRARAIAAFVRRYGTGLLVLLLALVAAGCFWLWTQPPRPRRTWHVGYSFSYDFPPDGRVLVWPYRDDLPGEGIDVVQLWDTATGEERLRISRAGRFFPSPRFSPDGRWMVMEDVRRELMVWDVTTRPHATLVRPFPDDQLSPVLGFCF